MAKEDWLTSYVNIEGIADVLARMSRRARQPNPLVHGEQEFLADVEGFTGDFHEWLDDARSLAGSGNPCNTYSTKRVEWNRNVSQFDCSGAKCGQCANA